MFKRSFGQKDRVNKIRKPSKRSFRDDAKQKLREQLNVAQGPPSAGSSPRLNSAIVTIVVGKDQRLFAAHEDVLAKSPFFAELCRDQFFEAHAKRIALVDEQPEIFAGILEYLYKGDYSPRLLHDRKRNTWVIENDDDISISSPRTDAGSVKTFETRSTTRPPLPPTVYDHRSNDFVLRDTAIYCSAERYGLDNLKRLAFRKQGLVSGIDIATILRSARYAYENTPETDTQLRAHYLSLIIRSRKTFKRSGTMQSEMELGGKLFFDLFVAMCNHIDDVRALGNLPGSTLVG